MPKKKDNEVVDWSQYNNTGFENVTQQDLGIPFLEIVQKGSAEYDEDHASHETKHIEGVGVGDIINTLTREIVHKSDGDPLAVVPFGYKRAWVEWKARTQGGGIVRTHTSDAILRETTRDPEKNQDVLPNGNIIVTTCYFFVLLPDYKDGDQPTQAVISLTSTQLKKARAWLNMAQARKHEGVTLPFFSHRYLLSTIAESNEKGSWRGWKMAVGDMVNDAATLALASENSATAAQSILAIGTSSDDEEIPI